MKKLKDRWEIKKNWQLIFPFLGLVALLFCSYLLSKAFLSFFPSLLHTITYKSILYPLILLITYVLYRVTIYLFHKLEKKWKITYKWEMIAIFIVFAITGSVSAKISEPIISFLGIHKGNTNGWIYWPVRLLLIFPAYQILLLITGWLFGQFTFFWDFEKKMLRRMGFAKMLRD
ncbi:prolipoprotein diacylglyceryl transferase [Aquimarina sp. TRL1]|uniref:DUF6787 family protein n=1 Tax=Aquimarina sp. (strain TRL1) TaxID=2736252 RepID=UPI0015898C99|nr:DUF6787 family protein [Aquimarina sp. TRL1]QKX06402.1 prolipoprotein diacylglyceryl transferase [Aquimarina sp. TRL1]